MKILHVTPYYAPAWAWGGVVTAVTGLSRAQARAGHEVAVLTTDTLGPGRRGEAGATTIDGVRVWRARTRGTSVRARLNLSWPLGFATAARELISGEDSEIVHCHELRTVETVVATRIAARAGIPTLLSPHGTLPRGSGRTALKVTWDAILGRRVLGRIRHVVALTPREAEDARKLWASHHLPLDNGRVSIVPNGVDATVADEERLRGGARRRIGVGEEDRVVLFLGRLHRRKRIPLLLEAFAELAGRCPRARLILAGPDEGALTGIRAAIARRDLGRRVLITGLVDDGGRRDLLAAADVLALLGSGEGMPMAALEALAAGLPVVLGEEWGLGEAVTEGVGLVVGDDPTVIALALERFTSPRAADTVGRRARELAVTRFAWPSVVRQIDAIALRIRQPVGLASGDG